jgi:two-component system nitrate/nitrite response regulator NarL
MTAALPAAPTAVPGRPANSPIRILLIDDHKTVLWGLEQLVRGESPRMEVVGTANDIGSALALAASLCPDVILLDLDLGGTSSVEILPELLSNHTSRALVLTGSSDQGILDMAVLRGACGVISKSAAPELVLKAIEKIHRGELWIDHAMLTRVLGSLMTPTRQVDPEAARKASLTSRERKIVAAILEGSGAPHKVLAQQLFISESTLRNHLSSIYQKLNVNNRLELYVYAVKHQLGDSDA